MEARSILGSIKAIQRGNTMEISVTTPMPHNTGDSNVVFKAYGWNDPGPELQFEFHMTEKCDWFSRSSVTPAFSTSSRFIDLMFYEQLSNFSDIGELLPSNQAVARMLSGINVRRETKNIWRLNIALFCRTMVPILIRSGCTRVRIIVDIEVKTMRQLRRLSRALAEQIVAQHESGQLVGEPVHTSRPAELWAELMQRLPPEMNNM